MTPAGIEPATFRFVAQHLNHCATAAPLTGRGGGSFFLCTESQLLLLDGLRVARVKITVSGISNRPNHCVVFAIHMRFKILAAARTTQSRHLCPVTCKLRTGVINWTLSVSMSWPSELWHRRVFPNYNQPFWRTTAVLLISALKIVAVYFFKTMIIAHEIRFNDSYGHYGCCHTLRFRNVTLHIWYFWKIIYRMRNAVCWKVWIRGRVM